MKRNVWLSLATFLTLTPWFHALCAETNHNFAKWEQDITAFDQKDRTNPPPKHAILFTGSSGIRLWNSLAQDFPEHQVINRGFGGCQIVDCTHFAGRIVFPYQPRMIVFRCGGNDLWEGISPEQAFADYKEFVAVVRAQLPQTEIVFISWNPTPARWEQRGKEKALNTLVEGYTKRTPHLKYIECYDMVLDANGEPRLELFVADKIHFNTAGYKLLADRVRPHLPK